MPTTVETMGKCYGRRPQGHSQSPRTRAASVFEGDDLVVPNKGIEVTSTFLPALPVVFMMMVCGLVKSISATSAHRAALGLER